MKMKGSGGVHRLDFIKVKYDLNATPECQGMTNNVSSWKTDE